MRDAAPAAFFAIAVFLAAAIGWGSAQAQEHRELGPHVHGTGSLQIAIEGNKVSMDFSAPANDIIGFEHLPTTDAQKKTLQEARDSLSKPLGLFDLVGAGQCSVTSAEVKFNAGDDDHATAGKPAAQPVTPGGEAEHGHADFDVDVVVTCTDANKLASIGFPYFKRFAAAQKLIVTVVSDSGQSQFEVSRDTATHAIK